MQEEETEAVAIARLIGAKESTTVGWVYRWNTGALAVRWAKGPQNVAASDPELSDAEKRALGFEGLAHIGNQSQPQD